MWIVSSAMWPIRSPVFIVLFGTVSSAVRLIQHPTFWSVFLPRFYPRHLSDLQSIRSRLLAKASLVANWKLRCVADALGKGIICYCFDFSDRREFSVKARGRDIPISPTGRRMLKALWPGPLPRKANPQCCCGKGTFGRD